MGTAVEMMAALEAKREIYSISPMKGTDSLPYPFSFSFFSL